MVTQERGEKLSELEDRSQRMQESAGKFSSEAHAVSRGCFIASVFALLFLFKSGCRNSSSESAFGKEIKTLNEKVK